MTMRLIGFIIFLVAPNCGGRSDHPYSVNYEIGDPGDIGIEVIEDIGEETTADIDHDNRLDRSGQEADGTATDLTSDPPLHSDTETENTDVTDEEIVTIQSNLSAIWANNGEDKITRGDCRASLDSASVHNSVWNGTTISVFGARNEVVAFSLVLEAADESVGEIAVQFDRLTGPGGTTIESTAATGDEVFDWTSRDIELFFVRYLPIEGLSRIFYETYDERHIPERFRRPYDSDGVGSGEWEDRPDHNQEYPDIAVPLDLEGSFTVEAGHSQLIWVDITIAEDAPTGTYSGQLIIRESGEVTRLVPVILQVHDFTLPDEPTLGTMLYLGYGDINQRYLGQESIWEDDDLEESELIRNRHFQVAHRHRVSLIGDEGSDSWEDDRPRSEWDVRLDGSLFTADHGYAGPGVGVGNGVYSIGTYGSWEWQDDGRSAMEEHAQAWEQWFQSNASTTAHFLYLIDESDDFPQIEQWSGWIDGSPSPGDQLTAFATMSLLDAQNHTPSLEMPCTWAASPGIDSEWSAALDAHATDGRPSCFYNGSRPYVGSFAIEDDGVAPRVIAWAQYKLDVDWWFYWESTYYNNYQGDEGQTNVFAQAHTFGEDHHFDSVLGQTGWNYSNGDGVLFYPGTDTIFTDDSYGVQGPFASLRLKTWRRGLQDAEYLTLAAQYDPERVQQIVDTLVPQVLHEYGVTDPSDPTWVLTDISWSTDPDDWEAARLELAGIIARAGE